MSKVNYAKIRNSQKRADTNPEEKVYEPISPLEVHSSQGGSLAYGDRTPYPVTSSKIESAGLTNLFGENVVMDNLDYINSLLGNQLPGTAAPQKRKKSKQKHDDASTQPRSSDKVVSPSSPAKANNDPLNVPLNSPGLDPIPSLLGPYEIENSYLPENKNVAPVEGEEKMKWRIGRNMSNMVSAKEAEMYEEYFQNEMNSDVGKRSMSLEDARVVKRDFLKAGIVIKTTGSAQTEGEAYGDDSIHIPTDPIPSSATQDMGNGKPPKSDFSSKLGLYIDYFQKSESSQYRVRKASQYLGNIAHHQVNSRTESQRSAQSKNNEQLEKMASQMKKLKAKIDDLQLTNELLSNERKTWKKKEHELLYRAQNAESELEKVQSKAKKYKEKLKYTQELLQREKLDNENNLLALRRVLANNISTVLEHKIHHYMNNDRGELHKEPQRHSASEKGGGNKKSNKDKEYRKNTNSNAHISMTNSENKGKAKRYEEGENVKNKWNNTSLKDKMSPLLSQKDQSFSDEDDDEDQNPPERFTTLSKSDEHDAEELIGRNRRLRGYSPRQSDYETSSELGSEFQYYFHGNHQDNSKKYQQIQHIQNQLSKLMEKDESQPYTGSHYSKANKRSIDQQISANKHRSKPQSSYSLKGANYSKTTSFSKQHEQNTRMYRKDLDDTLSPNEVLNPSFSNSESGWTTSLGK